SRNRLVALVNTRYLLFADADAVPDHGWATAMRRAFDRDERVAVVGARCVPVWPGHMPLLFDTAPALDMLGMFDLGPNPLEAPRIVGTSFALDRERLPATPPFSRELGRRPDSPFGQEEVHYCLAVRRAGWRLRYEPAAVIRHHVRPHRARWAWMRTRAFVAGQESRIVGHLEPLPRTMGPRDLLFRALIAPWFIAGRTRGADSSAQSGREI
ncbi:hypothetical protein LCGC14_2485670, partial [marine sediment metagenome]